jgi:hypothetical protein
MSPAKRREFGHALLPIDPSIRHDSVSVTAHYRLQRQLDSQIEVLGEQRLDAGDHAATVRLEGVRDIVAGSAK